LPNMLIDAGDADLASSPEMTMNATTLAGSSIASVSIV
jgi:hypothetical protein